MCLSTKPRSGGPEIQTKAGCARAVFVSMCSSESAGVDDAHHHDVSNSGDDGDPEPDGVAGHGLLLVLLALYRGGRGGSVDAGRGVEERMLAAVVVIRRGVHEGSCHNWDLGGGR